MVEFNLLKDRILGIVYKTTLTTMLKLPWCTRHIFSPWQFLVPNVIPFVIYSKRIPTWKGSSLCQNRRFALISYGENFCLKRAETQQGHTTLIIQFEFRPRRSMVNIMGNDHELVIFMNHNLVVSFNGNRKSFQNEKGEPPLCTLDKPVTSVDSFFLCL